MDEQVISAEQRLKILNTEIKGLKEQVSSERTQRLEEDAKMRIDRDAKIEKIQEKLKKVSEKIYAYNKLGKCSKIQQDILKQILEEVNTFEEKVVADSEDN